MGSVESGEFNGPVRLNKFLRTMDNFSSDQVSLQNSNQNEKAIRLQQSDQWEIKEDPEELRIVSSDKEKEGDFDDDDGRLTPQLPCLNQDSNKKKKKQLVKNALKKQQDLRKLKLNQPSSDEDDPLYLDQDQNIIQDHRNL